jgi:hypothetical protein
MDNNKVFILAYQIIVKSLRIRVIKTLLQLAKSPYCGYELKFVLLKLAAFACGISNTAIHKLPEKSDTGDIPRSQHSTSLKLALSHYGCTFGTLWKNSLLFREIHRYTRFFSREYYVHVWNLYNKSLVGKRKNLHLIFDLIFFLIPLAILQPLWITLLFLLNLPLLMIKLVAIPLNYPPLILAVRFLNLPLASYLKPALFLNFMIHTFGYALAYVHNLFFILVDLFYWILDWLSELFTYIQTFILRFFLFKVLGFFGLDFLTMSNTLVFATYRTFLFAVYTLLYYIIIGTYFQNIPIMVFYSVYTIILFCIISIGRTREEKDYLYEMVTEFLIPMFLCVSLIPYFNTKLDSPLSEPVERIFGDALDTTLIPEWILDTEFQHNHLIIFYKRDQILDRSRGYIETATHKQRRKYRYKHRRRKKRRFCSGYSRDHKARLRSYKAQRRANNRRFKREMRLNTRGQQLKDISVIKYLTKYAETLNASKVNYFKSEIWSRRNPTYRNPLIKLFSETKYSLFQEVRNSPVYKNIIDMQLKVTPYKTPHLNILNNLNAKDFPIKLSTFKNKYPSEKNILRQEFDFAMNQLQFNLVESIHSEDPPGKLTRKGRYRRKIRWRFHRGLKSLMPDSVTANASKSAFLRLYPSGAFQKHAAAGRVYMVYSQLLDEVQQQWTVEGYADNLYTSIELNQYRLGLLPHKFRNTKALTTSEGRPSYDHLVGTLQNAYGPDHNVFKTMQLRDERNMFPEEEKRRYVD